MYDLSERKIDTGEQCLFSEKHKTIMNHVHVLYIVHIVIYCSLPSQGTTDCTICMHFFKIFLEVTPQNPPHLPPLGASCLPRRCVPPAFTTIWEPSSFYFEPPTFKLIERPDIVWGSGRQCPASCGYPCGV